MAEFFNLSVSPWSEKARWAMDINNFEYKDAPYTPMITTPIVRLKSRNLFNPVTAPTLIDKGNVLNDSYKIAKYVSEDDVEERLFPDYLIHDINYWDHLSNRILEAGRALVVIRMRDNREAKINSLPPMIPKQARPTFIPLASMGLSYLKKKYRFSWEESEKYIQTIRKHLLELRKQLQKGDGYLLGRFTYADITMAVTLQTIDPVDNRYIPLDEATRQCWITPELREEFKDLIEWRDAIYQKHRH